MDRVRVGVVCDGRHDCGENPVGGAHTLADLEAIVRSGNMSILVVEVLGEFVALGRQGKAQFARPCTIGMKWSRQEWK